jgi:hypothetical protein
MDPVNGYRSPTGANYGWHPSNTYPQAPTHGSYGADTVNPPAGTAPASFVQKKHKHHHKKHHKANDIGDNGIDEAVHGFASADKSVLPQPWRRVKEAYPINGFKNPSFQWLDKKSLAEKKHKHHHKHHHKA